MSRRYVCLVHAAASGHSVPALTITLKLQNAKDLRGQVDYRCPLSELFIIDLYAGSCRKPLIKHPRETKTSANRPEYLELYAKRLALNYTLKFGADHRNTCMYIYTYSLHKYKLMHMQTHALCIEKLMKHLTTI